MRTKRIVAPVLLVILFAALLIQLPMAIAERTSVYSWFEPIQDVRYVLMERFVTEPNEEDMQKAMIDAMIETLDDPYTQYIPPADIADFNKDLRGTYAGIGAEVNIIDGYLTIVTPMEDSPALRAGIMAGDVVLEIEGVSTFEVPVTECVKLLTGKPGTMVTLRVRHLDESEVDIAVERANIVTRTVRGLRREGEGWSYCVDDELGLHYVRVSQFNAATSSELAAVLNELHADGLNGLILDLRDNPGGGLDTAVAMADMFLADGTIVSVRPRSGKENAAKADAKGTLPDFPMMVMVNGRSASASEIVAGALKQNGRAKILGTRSFGKGSVQEVRTLPYGRGTLKFTTAHYYLPSGRNLNRQTDSETWGVDPDPGFVLPVSDEDYFGMMLARREFEIIRDNGDEVEPCPGPDWIREEILDEQLAVAVESLQERMVQGEWPVFSDDDAAEVAFDQELHRAAERRSRMIEQIARLDERISELAELGEQAGREPLLPADAVLEGGTITVRDKEGNVVGSYRIDGGSVELALGAVELTPVEE